jgi:hypothetical protein
VYHHFDHLALLTACFVISVAVLAGGLLYANAALAFPAAIIALFYYKEMLVEGNYLRKLLLETEEPDETTPN